MVVVVGSSNRTTTTLAPITCSDIVSATVVLWGVIRISIIIVGQIKAAMDLERTLSLVLRYLTNAIED